MGLDMYLHRRRYVQNWDFLPENQRWTYAITRGDGRVLTPGKLTYVLDEIAYWRKANQVHHWFVDIVQKGTDDCGEYYVRQDQLGDLFSRGRRIFAADEKIGKLVAKALDASVGPEERTAFWEKITHLAADSEPVKKLAHDLLPTQPGFFFSGTDYDEWYFYGLRETLIQLAPFVAVESGY